MPDEHGMPLPDDVCECGKLSIDHTIRELREHSPAKTHLPYEEDGGLTYQPAETHGPMAGMVVCKAAIIESDRRVPGLPKAVPAIAFVFFGPDGLTEVAKAVLVLDDAGMERLRSLLNESIDGAIRAARSLR